MTFGSIHIRYAGISINWGGNRLNFGRFTMTYDGPQTDWGRRDAQITLEIDMFKYE